MVSCAGEFMDRAINLETIAEPRVARLGAVLLDLDGTLLDTAADIAEAVNRTLADYGLLPLQADQVRQFIGLGIAHLMRQVLALSQLGGAPTHAEAIARFDVHYTDTNGKLACAYPGVFAGLDALAAEGWKLGCVTNKPQRFVDPLLEATGLGKYFACVVCGDSLPTMKPSAEPLLHACRALDADPARSFMIGDSLHDVRAARAAGMPSYVVPYGYCAGRDLATLLQSPTVSRLDDLAPLLAASQP